MAALRYPVIHLRIAHIVDAMDVGGKEMFVVSLCRLQREMGDAPEVHCLDHVGSMGETLEREGFPVHLIRASGRLAVWNELRTALRGVRVVHCHNVQASVAGAPAARLAGVPVVIGTRHNLAAPPYRWKHELQYSLIMRWFSSRTVAVCEAAARNLRRLPLAPAARILAIHNGAQSPPPEFTASPLPVKQGYTFVQVSRLARPKDPDTMLAAFLQASSRREDLRLWIVGDGPLRPSVETLVRQLGLGDRVTLFGQRRDVGGFLAAADCFVLSSRSEGVPMAQLEAMSLGLPMIVTDTGGMPEVLPPGEAFTAVPAGDTGAMAAAMLRAADRAAERPRWAEIARHHYQQRFTLGRMAADYARLYGLA